MVLNVLKKKKKFFLIFSFNKILPLFIIFLHFQFFYQIKDHFFINSTMYNKVTLRYIIFKN